MEKGQQTRQRVIAQAATIFNQRGLAGSTLADLMEATGLQKGGIYRHFESKEQLALEAFDYAFALADHLRFERIDGSAHTVDQLKTFVHNFVHLRSPVTGGCPIFNTAVENDDGNPALRERAREALSTWLDRLAEIVREGQAKGQISAEVKPDQLAVILVSSLEGALVVSRLHCNVEALETVGAHLAGYLEQCREPESVLAS